MGYWEKERTVHHSWGYHRFFEGYSESKNSASDGGGHGIRRIYTAEYYERQLDKKESILVKLVYGIAIVAAVCAFIKGAVMDVPGNYTAYVTIFEAFEVPCLAGVCFSVINWIMAGQHMKIREFRHSSQNLKRFTWAGIASAGGAAAASVVCMGLKGSFTAAGLISAGNFALTALLLLAINRIEYKVVYYTEENPEKAPKTAYQIS